VIENKVSGGKYGIDLRRSEDSIVSGNVVSSSSQGIYLERSSDSTVSENIVSNTGKGIRLTRSDFCIVNGNEVSESTFGIFLYYYSNSNEVKENTVSNNDYGMYSYNCYYNNIYHNNIIDNTNQAYDNRDNTWDNGYPSGGNYWSDFDESSEGAYDDYKGADQDQTGSDGIVDSPYIIDSNSQDNYPLMEQYTT
jgi:parallel beta-helix repeat protein